MIMQMTQPLGENLTKWFRNKENFDITFWLDGNTTARIEPKFAKGSSNVAYYNFHLSYRDGMIEMIDIITDCKDKQMFLEIRTSMCDRILQIDYVKQRTMEDYIIDSTK